jgi:hypothetical protein
MPKDITIRKAKPSDHASVITALQDWWGGRDLTAMLPKLFLDPFHDTSFVIIRSCLQKCFKWTSYCLIRYARAVKS